MYTFQPGAEPLGWMVPSLGSIVNVFNRENKASVNRSSSVG